MSIVALTRSKENTIKRIASCDYEHYKKKNGWLPIIEINNPIASVLKKSNWDIRQLQMSIPIHNFMFCSCMIMYIPEFS